MYGVRKSVAIYFNDFIQKDKIKELVRRAAEMTGASFTAKRAQGEAKIRQIRGGWESVFDRTFKNSAFDRGANVLTLTDASKDKLQTTQISMTLQNPDRHGCTSYILMHCMPDTSFERIISFIHTAGSLLRLQFVSGGYDVVSNDFLYPGSAAYSLKLLQGIKYANSQWTEWGGLMFSANKGIPCPNIVQFLPGQFWQEVKNRVNRPFFHIENLQTGVILDILDRREGRLCEPEKDVLMHRLSRLYRALKPIIVPTPKPMFLREKEWIKWQKPISPHPCPRQNNNHPKPANYFTA